MGHWTVHSLKARQNTGTVSVQLGSALRMCSWEFIWREKDQLVLATKNTQNATTDAEEVHEIKRKKKNICALLFKLKMLSNTGGINLLYPRRSQVCLQVQVQWSNGNDKAKVIECQTRFTGSPPCDIFTAIFLFIATVFYLLATILLRPYSYY